MVRVPVFPWRVVCAFGVVFLLAGGWLLLRERPEPPADPIRAKYQLAPFDSTFGLRETLSIPLHAQALADFFAQPPVSLRPEALVVRVDESVRQCYEHYARGYSPKSQRIGFWGLAVYHLRAGRPREALNWLRQLDGDDEHFQAAWAQAFAATGQLSSAEAAYARALETGIDTARTWVGRIRVANALENRAALQEWAARPELRPYFPATLLGQLDRESGSVRRWLRRYLRPVNDPIGLWAGALVLGVWLLLLSQMKLFTKLPLRGAGVALVVGCVLGPVGVWLLEWLGDGWGFTARGNVSDFGYEVVGIGGIEEGLKLLAACLGWRWVAAKRREPIDIFLLAAAAALGFSFVENALRVNELGTEVLSRRAVLATSAHLIAASFWAVGWIGVVYRGRPKVALLGWFAASMLFHGCYDALLISGSSVAWWVALLLVAFGIGWVWLVVGNALGISRWFHYGVRLPVGRLRLLAFGGFGLVLLAQFLLSVGSLGIIQASDLLLADSLGTSIALLLWVGLVPLAQPLAGQWRWPTVRWLKATIRGWGWAGRPVRIEGFTGRTLDLSLEGRMEGEAPLRGGAMGYWLGLAQPGSHLGQRIERLVIKPDLKKRLPTRGHVPVIVLRATGQGEGMMAHRKLGEGTLTYLDQAAQPPWLERWERWLARFGIAWSSMWVLAVVILLVTLLTGAELSVVERVAQRRYVDAQRTILSGNIEEGEKITSELVGMRSDWVMALMLRAKVDAHLGNYNTARSRLIDAELAGAPLDWSFLYLRGRCQLALDRPDRAFSDLSFAYRQNPKLDSVPKWLGELSLARGDQPNAFNYLTVYLRAHPGDAEAWLDRSQAAFANSRFEQAAEDLDRVLLLHPSDGEALFLRAKLHYREGNQADACRLLGDAITARYSPAFELAERWCRGD